MKNLNIFLIFILILSSCNNSRVEKMSERIIELERSNRILIDSIKNFKKAESDFDKETAQKQRKYDSLRNIEVFFNKGTSFFSKTAENSGYTKNEITYDIVYISPNETYKTATTFISKNSRKTESCIGCENKIEDIKIELSSFYEPEKILHTIEKKCNNIELESNIYKTAIYGCCLLHNTYEYFDYNNKSIIKSNLNIISSNIPNSKIDFYIGYIFDENPKETRVFNGTLTFAYAHSDKYLIKINSNTGHDWLNTKIDLVSNDKRDYKTVDGFDLWSLNGIKAKEQINDIKIVLKINDKNVLEIPIIEGKPYGKSNRIQEVTIR
jgi:hypothetical protein